ncbi:hypothetical protein CPAV1605_847 [seawater metagenome]|uniref:Uncharacterized protein n=1 Tax=seawater metagenome TaxID=1561972 RepID=A0A5E8CLY2_9ZZZZ
MDNNIPITSIYGPLDDYTIKRDSTFPRIPKGFPFNQVFLITIVLSLVIGLIWYKRWRTQGYCYKIMNLDDNQDIVNGYYKKIPTYILKKNLRSKKIYSNIAGDVIFIKENNKYNIYKYGNNNETLMNISENNCQEETCNNYGSFEKLPITTPVLANNSEIEISYGFFEKCHKDFKYPKE